MPGGTILHCGAIKIRVVGSGLLRPTLLGYDEVESVDLFNETLSEKNSQEVLFLADFIGERIKLRLRQTDHLDFMKVNTISLFFAPIWDEYPG
jgi:hypothetical protein